MTGGHKGEHGNSQLLLEYLPLYTIGESFLFLVSIDSDRAHNCRLCFNCAVLVLHAVGHVRVFSGPVVDRCYPLRDS